MDIYHKIDRNGDHYWVVRNDDGKDLAMSCEHYPDAAECRKWADIVKMFIPQAQYLDETDVPGDHPAHKR